MAYAQTLSFKSAIDACTFPLKKKSYLQLQPGSEYSPGSWEVSRSAQSSQKETLGLCWTAADGLINAVINLECTNCFIWMENANCCFSSPD